MSPSVIIIISTCEDLSNIQILELNGDIPWMDNVSLSMAWKVYLAR